MPIVGKGIRVRWELSLTWSLMIVREGNSVVRVPRSSTFSLKTAAEHMQSDMEAVDF